MKKKSESVTVAETTGTPPYRFMYDGHECEFSRATVRSGVEARRIVVTLLRAYGYVDGNTAPDSEYALFDEFGASMARIKTDAPWWAHSNMSEEEAKRRFELWIDCDESLYVELRNASAATRMEKKAIPMP